MKIFGRVLLVLMIAASFGCQTTQGQSGGAASSGTSAAPAMSSTSSSSSSSTTSTSSSSSSGVRMLTEADYKRIGVRETGDKR